MFFKSAFLELHQHSAWKSSSTEVPKTDRLRRSFFLGRGATKVPTSLEQKRKSIHHNRYFVQNLLDFDAQRIEAEEGEEEAEYGAYAAAKQSQIRLMSTPGQSLRLGKAYLAGEAFPAEAVDLGKEESCD